MRTLAFLFLSLITPNLLAQDIELEFRLIEMPAKVLDSMRPYLSKDATSAQAAFEKLDSIPNCKTIATLDADAQSGEHGKAEPLGKEAIGKPPETYPLGLTVEFDPISSKDEETDLNLVADFWERTGGDATGFQLINSYRLEKAWPRIISIRNTTDPESVNVLFATSSPTSPSNNGIGKAEEYEIEIAFYELADEAQAKAAAASPPATGAETVLKDGKLLSKETTFLRPRVRARSAAFTCDADSLKDWNEVSLSLELLIPTPGQTPTLKITRNETTDSNNEISGEGEASLEKETPILIPIQAGQFPRKIMAIATLK